jgi:hypothetical protein
MQIARRSFLKGATAALAIVSVAPAMLISGCASQQTIADLINTLGVATEQLATLEGNTSLSAKLATDVAAASSAVLNWKKGSATQEIAEALNLVEDDINLFPGAGPYVPLIDLAIGTIEAILAQFPSTTATVSAKRRTVKLPYKAPKNNKDFAKRWNTLAPPQASIKVPE